MKEKSESEIDPGGQNWRRAAQPRLTVSANETEKRRG